MVDTLLLNWTLHQFLELTVILTRVGPLIFLMPVTGSRGVPVQIKILFSLMTALVLLPVVHISKEDLPATAVGYGILVVCEVGIAVILSLFVRFFFAATQLAGEHISISMGIGMAAAIDPQFGTQIALVGTFMNLVAILIFLAMNGHHVFISSMVESFNWIHPGTLHLTQATFNGLMSGAARMFSLGVQIMAPAGAALFFSNVATGILAKTVPQIPIMIVGMPLNIAIGFIFVGISMGYFLPVMVSNFETMGSMLMKLAAGLG